MSSVYLAFLSRTNINLQKISEEGCAPHCAVLCEGPNNTSSQFGELVVGSTLTMFFQADDRLSCYLLSEQKHIMWFYGLFLGIISHDENVQRSSITIYDIRSKVIAFSLKLDQIIHVSILTGGNVYLVNTRGEVNVLTELSLRHKMMLLLKRDLYNVALALASQYPHDKKIILDITMKYGDYLYNKGDYDAATLQYIETIGVVEPSLIISKFLFSQRINCLTTYLEALHDRIATSTEHTTLLLTCYTKLKDIYKLSTFLLNSRALRLQSCAVPYETTFAIEHLLLHCTSINTDIQENTRALSNISDIQQLSMYDRTKQQQLLNDSREQIYQSVSYYNTIDLYLQCSFPYHALFLSLLYGAHHFVVTILIQLQLYDEVIKYLYTMPAHIVFYLLHVHGLKMVRHKKKEITELCIKLVCGWKQRADVVHTLIIQFDTYDDNSVSGSSDLKAKFSSDHISECQFDTPAAISQSTSSSHRGFGESTDPLSDEPSRGMGSSPAIAGAGSSSMAGAGGRPIRTNVMKLQIQIGDDGRVILLHCAGLGTSYQNLNQDTASTASNDNLLLVPGSLIHTKIAQQQAKIEETLLSLRQELEQCQRSLNAAGGGASQQPSSHGEVTLTLSDFASSSTTTAEQQQISSITQQIAKLERKLKELQHSVIQEHLIVSPSDLTPVFSDHPDELQLFLESITSHATIVQQKHQNSAIASGAKSSSSANIPLDQDNKPIFVKKNESHLIKLNTQTSVTTAYDTTRFGDSSSSAISLTSDDSIMESSSLVIKGSSGSGGSGKLVPVAIHTHVLCGSQLWTSLVELYAQMIKTISSVSSSQHQQQQQQQYSQNASGGDGKDISTLDDGVGSDNLMGEAHLRRLTFEQRHRSIIDLEQKVNTLIKKNFDYFDHASILVVLESYNLDLPLSFLYSRTRQFHSLLTLHLNKGDWIRARSVCSAFAQHEPSLWLFLLIKVVEHYDSPDTFTINNGANAPGATPGGPATSSITALGGSSASGANVVGNIKPNDLLYECIENIQAQSLLSPLEIVSILSSNPKITIAPVRNYLLQILTQFQEGNKNYIEETILYQNDARALKQQLEDLQQKPIRFQSIDCAHCSLPLSIPAVHFLCRHSFHVSCANEIDVGAGSRKNDSQSHHHNTSQYECPVCAQENKKLQLLTQSMKSTSITHEKFYKKLDEAKEPFNVIGDFIAKGVFDTEDDNSD